MCVYKWTLVQNCYSEKVSLYQGCGAAFLVHAPYVFATRISTDFCDCRLCSPEGKWKKKLAADGLVLKLAADGPVQRLVFILELADAQSNPLLQSHSQKRDPHILKPPPLHHHQKLLSLPKPIASSSEQRICWPSWSSVIRNHTCKTILIVSCPQFAAGLECEKKTRSCKTEGECAGMWEQTVMVCKFCNNVRNDRFRNT